MNKLQAIMKNPKLKVLKSSDEVSIIFSTWFSGQGVTYFDATVFINDTRYEIAYTNGYHAGSVQSIYEVLEKCGYRIRANKNNPHAPLKYITTRKGECLKRDLIKVTKSFK